MTLDSAIRLPGGFKVGFDGLLGLVLVVGDLVAGLVSLFFIYRGAQLGLPVHQLARMLGNILVETVVGVIPLLGDVFDFAWKSNEKNMSIVEQHASIDDPVNEPFTRLSLAALVVVGFGLLALVL